MAFSAHLSIVVGTSSNSNTLLTRLEFKTVCHFSIRWRWSLSVVLAYPAWLVKSQISQIIYKVTKVVLLPSFCFLLVHERENKCDLRIIRCIDVSIYRQVDFAVLHKRLYFLSIAIKWRGLVDSKLFFGISHFAFGFRYRCKIS